MPYQCSEDFFTLEDISTPCVSAGDDMCTSCENIKKLRQANVVAFNDNPLAKIFGIPHATAKQTKQIWASLHTQCGINTPSAKESTKQQMRPVIQPDLADLTINIQKISRRLKKTEHDRKRITQYLIAFQRMALLPYKWNADITLKTVSTEESFIRVMKQDILDIVEKYNLKFGGAHHPREIPMAVGIYVSELTRAPSAKFTKSITFLIKQAGCAEGVIQLASDQLVR